MTTTHEVQPKGRIAELIRIGIEAWAEAGRLVVERTDAGETLDKIAEEEGIAKELLGKFERIGRGMLYPRLLLSTTEGARALQRCPPSDQEHYANNPVSLVVDRGGRTETLLVQLENLTPSQCAQVFGRNHVRTEAEQKAYLESRMAKALVRRVSVADEGLGYAVQGARVTFQRGCALTKDDLIQILGRMK